MSKLKEKIIFDANFFICMNSIKARNILENLSVAGKELGLEYYISSIVFEEIKSSESFKEKFKEFINIKEIHQTQISEIKLNLSSYGIRFPAQDPDLSLLALAKDLLDDKQKNLVHLVSDDFKLVKNSNIIFKNKLNNLSLSSFLLKLQRTIPNKQMRSYFKNVWKRSLNYTLSYMIERSKMYPAEEKITWLIERAVSVTESSILTQDSQLIDSRTGEVKFQIGTSKYEAEISIAEKYIEHQNLPNNEEERISEILNFLENLKISREYVKRSRDAIIKNESKEAAKYLKKGNGFLISLLQVAAGQLIAQ